MVCHEYHGGCPTKGRSGAEAVDLTLGPAVGMIMAI